VVETREYSEMRDAISHDWVTYLNCTIPECQVVVIPNQTSDPATWLKVYSIDAVILSNGEDLLVSPERDTVEYKIIRYALLTGIKIFGACRGMQVINKFFDGDLPENLDADYEINHVATKHTVDIIDERYRRGSSDQITVNSYHRQGIRNSMLSDQLRPFAICGDLVEGLYHPDYPVLGVQWHPERAGSCREYDEELIKKVFFS
jgi:putative glutamine amidotransferase